MKEPLFNSLAATLIKQIEQGNAPWQRSFPSGVQYLPFNPSNGSAYHGINIIQLLSQNRTDPRWMTYNQIKELGGQVRSGEEGTKVQYWKFTEEQKVTVDGKEQIRKVDLKTPQVFYATVFNAEQVDNLPQSTHPCLEDLNKIEPKSAVDACLAQITVENDLPNSKCPYYSKQKDVIHLPTKENTVEYYQAALYQAARWTSSEHRMNREVGPSGSPVRAIEELRCQIATLVMGSKLGIGYTPSPLTQGGTAVNLIEALKENPVEIFRAASQAEKIVTNISDMCQGKEVFEKREIEQPITAKVYLSVPYGERNAAKALGAKWDPQEKSWFSEEETTTKKLERWLPENQKKESTLSMSPREEFSSLMKEIGFELEGDHPIMDSKPHRARIAGDKHGEVGGFYVAHLDGHPAGFAKNNRTNQEIQWKAKGYTFSEEQKAILNAEAAQNRQQRDENREKDHQAALLRIEEQIKSSTFIETHPYLDKKRIQVTDGIKVSQYNSLIVLAYNAAGEIQTAQYINEEGTKRFAKDAKREGSFHPIGGFSQVQKSNTIVIAEGYATANTIASVCPANVAVVASLSAGNIESVAKALHEKFPEKQIFIAADRDKVGLEFAQKAAQQVNGTVIAPSFSEADFKENPSLNDFNDLCALKGPHELKAHLAQVIETPKENLKVATRELAGIER